jgi:tripartite ATP-independent transporter DctM subunit
MNTALSLAAFVAMFALMLLRVPIGIAMGIVGAAGFAWLTGLPAAVALVGSSPLRSAGDPSLGIVPMFILMGALASTTGLSQELFRAAHAWMGHLRGGLAYAAMSACAGFAAINGSSVATAVTMTKVALPEMRRFGMRPSLAAGTLAAGGTLGIMIPPSVVFVLYGIMTDQDIGKLFMAGVVPGLLAVVLYAATIYLLGRIRPEDLPAGERAPWGQRWQSVRGLWGTAALFLFVLGGMYFGVFTPTEAAAMGVFGALLIGCIRGRMSWRILGQALGETLSVSASIFTIVIGAYLFGYFLSVAGTTRALIDFIVHLDFNRYAILFFVLVMYLFLGAIMDELAMILLTVPVVYPAMMQLGFDPIWFGVIIVMTVTFGLICPPVGMNVFVVNALARDIRLSDIYRGVAPFIAADVVRLALLVAFPGLSIWLPSLMK